MCQCGEEIFGALFKKPPVLLLSPCCSLRQVFNPFQFILPRGQLFTFTSRDGWIVDYKTNTWLQPVPRLRGYADTQWPYSATGAMLALLPENDYQVRPVLSTCDL